MDIQMKKFLERQRVSVLGIFQSKNIIHSAALHFAFTESPLEFYFITEKESRKCKSLQDNAQHAASLVIGFSEEEFVTFQAEGKVKIVSNESELKKGWDVYGKKFESRAKLKSDTNMVLLQFTPTWWKYTDLKTKTTISAED